MKYPTELDFCLLIPCYNNYQGLIESIRSVSYSRPFLVLVVDDGSAQPITSHMITNDVGDTMSVEILRNEKNVGITRALNKGMMWIQENTRARYTARLDCGDLCLPQRFTEQVNFLDANHSVGLLGSWCLFVDEITSERFTYKSRGSHEVISRDMYLKNVFMHATVMFRTDLAKKAGNYPLQFELAEDYAFFWRLMQLSRTAILEKVLVVCRLNRGGISYQNKGKQLAARWKVVRSFATKPLLTIVAFFRIGLLFIIPKGLNLRLKKMKG